MNFLKYFLYSLLYISLAASGILLFKMYINDNSVNSQNNNFQMMTVSEQWNVISIHDGDTIKASKNRQIERFRLCGIDAPEISQPLGKDSRDYLRSLISPKNKISISVTDRDRYGRKVAEIFLVESSGEKFLNEELVKAGLAYHYVQYSNNCPNKISLENAEAIAKSKGVGVWNGDHQAPWDYRRSKRKKNS